MTENFKVLIEILVVYLKKQLKKLFYENIRLKQLFFAFFFGLTNISDFFHLLCF